MNDTFRGDNVALVNSINALLSLDEAGALVPHGIGGHAHTLLQSAATRLAALAPPSGEGVDAPPAWQNIDNAEAEFLRNLADNGGLAPLVSGMLRHCARLLDRTTPESALTQRFRQAVRSLAGLKGEKPTVYAACRLHHD